MPADNFWCSLIGRLWLKQYVNGRTVPMSMADLPRDGWFHLHLVSTREFTDNLNIMSMAAGGALIDYSCLAGRVAEVIIIILLMLRKTVT
jgi:hypothetical protein